MDYERMAYNTASETILKTRDPIHNITSRICIWALRWSPIESLYIESGETSLALRRNYLSQAYASSIISKSDHKKHSTFTNIDTTEKWFSSGEITNFCNS